MPRRSGPNAAADEAQAAVEAEIWRILEGWDLRGSKLLGADATADLLDLDNSHTLAVWRSTHRYADELPWRKIGRNVRYLAWDVARFLVLRARGRRHTPK